MNEAFVAWLANVEGKECLTAKPPNALALAFEAGARSRQPEINTIKIDMLTAAKRICAQSDLLARCAEIEVGCCIDQSAKKRRFVAEFYLTEAQVCLAKCEAGIRSALADIIHETLDYNWFHENGR